MNRDTIFKEIKDTLGLVPSFFQKLPDDVLILEWENFKINELNEGPVPHKVRQLMGITLSAATHCRYCTYYHTEMARLHGASDAEIEFASRFAKHSSGWSSYVHGMQVDYDTFRKEIGAVCDHVRSGR